MTTEFAFLSAEVDNDFDHSDEELDRGSSRVSDIASKATEGKPVVSQEISKETVEICQKTVNPHNRVNTENFKIQRVIGKGGYGKVFLVQKVDGIDRDKLYAMKVLKKARLVCNEKDKAHTVSERNILQMLRHPFLVKLHYAFQNHSTLYIVLEYCPGGELFSYLEKEGALMENSAWAPEIIRCEGHGKAVDWWSLGTLLYDMLSGGILHAPLKFPPTFSPEVTSLIRGLLRRNPAERLGSREDVEEIKKHKYFRRHDINWPDVFHRRLKPPFRPKLASENDVSMFDPNFTRLQPVVSPAEAGRTIPPDMFQGFSYVAPSVCVDSMREPWIGGDSRDLRRRQYGNRDALSAGRLRRLGVTPNNWSGRPLAAPNNQQAPPQPHMNNCTALQPHPTDLAQFDCIVPFRDRDTQLMDGIQPERANENPSTPNLPLSLSQATISGSLETESPGLNEMEIVESNGGIELEAGQEVDDDDDNDADGEEEEEEEELDEENVPGAKQIHTMNSPMYNVPPCHEHTETRVTPITRPPNGHISSSRSTASPNRTRPHLPSSTTVRNSITQQRGQASMRPNTMDSRRSYHPNGRPSGDQHPRPNGPMRANVHSQNYLRAGPSTGGLGQPMTIDTATTSTQNAAKCVLM